MSTLDLCFKIMMLFFHSKDKYVCYILLQCLSHPNYMLFYLSMFLYDCENLTVS